MAEYCVDASASSFEKEAPGSRDDEESSNDAHPCNDNSPKNKNAAGSAEFRVDKQRDNYRLRQEGTTSQMTLSRAQELESLGSNGNGTATALPGKII
jgi:hypothetical protein